MKNDLLFADFHFQLYRVKFSGPTVSVYTLKGDSYHQLVEYDNDGQYVPSVPGARKVIAQWKSESRKRGQKSE